MFKTATFDRSNINYIVEFTFGWWLPVHMAIFTGNWVAVIYIFHVIRKIQSNI